jgi:uncharacterized protein YbjT (DUF2867 family)
MRQVKFFFSVAGLPPKIMEAYTIIRVRPLADRFPFIALRDRAKKDRAKLTPEDKTDFSDTACGRARLLAGRMASPIDEASIPPGRVFLCSRTNAQTRIKSKA